MRKIDETDLNLLITLQDLLSERAMDESLPIPPSRWMVIVNPNAGVKKGAKEWPKILEMIRHEGIDHQHQYTKHKNHAIHLTREAIEKGYRSIAVVGGDGTLNEALNGVFLQQSCPVSEITLGMIPVGTGNDWCRMFNIPFDFNRAVQLLKERKTFIQDIGKVTYYHKQEREERYFMNVAGMAYDALVAKKTNLLKEKGHGGPLTYLWFIFASLFQYNFLDAVIEVDSETVFKGEVFSMNVGICKYNGGGMMQLPFAIADDGLLDVTLIKKAPKWMVIRHTRKLYDGTLIDLPFIKTFQGKTIRIRSTQKIFLETDGESLGHTPFTYEILPGAVRVVVGKE
ncbi:MAG: diacylglycerol kinase family lipid kinase [Bacteroidales bacterium]|nr:diacylglycerol kinase family lipid kinase [Bacteroidales bacterium]